MLDIAIAKIRWIKQEATTALDARLDIAENLKGFDRATIAVLLW
jgi:hypothetical protein